LFEIVFDDFSQASVFDDLFEIENSLVISYFLHLDITQLLQCLDVFFVDGEHVGVLFVDDIDAVIVDAFGFECLIEHFHDLPCIEEYRDDQSQDAYIFQKSRYGRRSEITYQTDDQ
jgi:hypothetical protein